MNKAREAKVAVVDGVKDRVGDTTTAVATEYRGLTVAEISSLRKELRRVGAEYKVLKNTLVRRAVAGTEVESITEFLTGPTAIAWVKGDISAVAKVLREFAKDTPTLVLKGGVLDGKALSVKDLVALADLPSREVLLAQFAGALAAPLRQMAGLMKAVPQNFAYGLAALLDARGGAVAPAPEAESEVEAEESPATETVVDATEEPAESDSAEPTEEAASPAAEQENE